MMFKRNLNIVCKQERAIVFALAWVPLDYDLLTASIRGSFLVEIDSQVSLVSVKTAAKEPFLALDVVPL